METVPLKFRLAKDMMNGIREQEKLIHEAEVFMEDHGETEYNRRTLAKDKMLLSKMKAALKDLTGIDYDEYYMYEEFISYTHNIDLKGMRYPKVDKNTENEVSF